MLRLFLLLALVSKTAHGDPERVVVADLGLHVVGAGFQDAVSSHVALQVDLESYTPWTQEDTFYELQGLVVRARPVFYAAAGTPTRWWLSPFAQAGIGWGTRDGTRQSGPVWATGASIGYAWLVWSHLHIAIGAGIQYDVARIPGGDSKPSFATVWPTIDGTIGYAF